MSDHNKETVWITIPDEKAPALEAPVAKPKKQSAEKVENRAFWGAGFIALLAFVGILFAPQEFAKLMQGQLFDGSFQVVPDYEDQSQGELFGGEEDGEESESEAESTDQNVVEAESEAVSIQIEPITEAEEFEVDPVEETETEEASETEEGDTEAEEEGELKESAPETEPTTEAEPIELDDTEAADSEGAAETETPEESLDSNTQLIQLLSQQLEEFKDKQRQSDQQIQDLMQLLQDQSAGLHGAGTTQVSPSLLPQGQPTAAVNQFNQQTAGVYRYNTHTVTVSPYDVLAQNQGFQQASMQANVAYQGVQAYSNQQYNPVLAGAPAQPGTGPAESLLFALAIGSLGVLVWGSMRAIRA